MLFVSGEHAPDTPDGSPDMTTTETATSIAFDDAMALASLINGVQRNARIGWVALGAPVFGTITKIQAREGVREWAVPGPQHDMINDCWVLIQVDAKFKLHGDDGNGPMPMLRSVKDLVFSLQNSTTVIDPNEAI